MTDVRQPLRVAVIKFASCDGCQLAFLGLGPALLDIGSTFSIVEFGEVSSRRTPEGPFDVLFVEGSVSSEEQRRHLLTLRERSTTLVVIGACATSGGIQALRNWGARDPEAVPVGTGIYPEPGYLDSLATSTPIADHVTVDAELRGCPIDTGQLVELLSATAAGRRPQLPDEAVCVACKRAGRVCVMVASGEPCLGPLIQAGCGALCPGYARGCYGCFGPRERANGPSLAGWFGEALERPPAEVAARFAGFTGWSPSLRSVIDDHGGPPGFSTVPAPSATEGGDDR
jgi:coenzyme F420-reducing hydrogenase gamma subunit